MPQTLPLKKPALRPALLLGAALLLSGCSLLSPKDKEAEALGIDTSGPPAFTLEVDAPKQVRALLEQHLELKRFRHQPDLQRRELTRLLGATDANVRELIGTLGYFSPTVTVELTDTPEEEAPRKVVVRVDPGPPTIIEKSEVRFAGINASDELGTSQRLQIEETWPLQAGEQFSQSAWSSAKSGGLKELQKRRYPLARIDTSLADVDADTNKAQVSVSYDPGPAYTFGPLQIDGAERYDPVRTARIARLPEGQEYDLQSMLDAQQRLVSSGYYDSVFLSLADSPQQAATDAERDEQRKNQGAAITSPVIAKVREAKLQKWVFGVGLSTDTGPRLSIDHTYNKVPGLNWRAVSKLQLDRKNPLISTQLVGLPGEDLWRWFASGKLERAPAGDFYTNSAQMRFGRSKAEDRIERNMYLQYDYAKTQGAGAPPGASSLLANYGWTARYFDNNLLPSSGFGLALEAGAGTTLTPQRSPFGRLTGRWLSLIPLGERDEETRRHSRLQLKAGIGAVMAKKDVDLPTTIMFLTGGDNTVRGYGYQSIGARTENDRVIAGRYLAMGSVEWQRPITIKGNTQDFEHAVFIDAGTVGDDINRLYTRVGFGTGIRWKSPVGPIQADLAWGAQEQQLRLHLRLGFTF
ncbi:BamA/TamA family outer membrane protein [Comamonas testosteroni]|uniref:autotransporter assembly complex protein TamA n=1 Tax=Comamonas testosteroni TaxID=285 RepID=UPI0023AB2F91|nr:BamA/TamA family outer membrane protein [Comamonas testosteroni]WEE76891.1 BamA/TamA family outer membrane protein [Comamonas testosteroni]